MVAALALAAATPGFSESGVARVAIIIDDLGYLKSEGRRALALPGAITYAVATSHPVRQLVLRLKHMRKTRKSCCICRWSRNAGHALGPGGITTHMTRAELVEGPDR